jgi:hypothetical protein
VYRIQVTIELDRPSRCFPLQPDDDRWRLRPIRVYALDTEPISSEYFAEPVRDRSRFTRWAWDIYKGTGRLQQTINVNRPSNTPAHSFIHHICVLGCPSGIVDLSSVGVLAGATILADFRSHRRSWLTDSETSNHTPNHTMADEDELIDEDEELNWPAIIIAAIVIIGLIGGLVWYFLIREVPEEDLNKEPDYVVPESLVEEAVYADMPDMIISPLDSKGRFYLIVKFDVVMNDRSAAFNEMMLKPYN